MKSINKKNILIAICVVVVIIIGIYYCTLMLKVYYNLLPDENTLPIDTDKQSELFIGAELNSLIEQGKTITNELLFIETLECIKSYRKSVLLYTEGEYLVLSNKDKRINEFIKDKNYGKYTKYYLIDETMVVFWEY